MNPVIVQGVVKQRVDQLVVGQRVDLEGDDCADPLYEYTGDDPSVSAHPEFQFEYEVVSTIERESDTCTCVYFESELACGFPPDHLVDIDPEQVLP